MKVYSLRTCEIPSYTWRQVNVSVVSQSTYNSAPPDGEIMSLKRNAPVAADQPENKSARVDPNIDGQRPDGVGPDGIGPLARLDVDLENFLQHVIATLHYLITLT